MEEPSAVDLLEGAVHLLRRTPAAWTAYLAGAVPFLLGALWFWSDMSRGALARQRCSLAALGLAALYIWKRACHSRFCALLRAAAADQPAPPWGWRDWRAVMALHMRRSAWSLIALPFALAVALPAGWWLAYHQSLSAVCERPASDAANAGRRAWQAAMLWPRQNHLALSVLAMLGVVVFVNVFVAAALAPVLLRSLLGVRLSYAASGAWMLNTTFLAAVLAATHLAMDAPLKAFYALRVFHADARRSGLDLLAEWRRIRRASLAAVAGLLLFVAVGPSSADSPPEPSARAPISAAELDDAIERVLARPQFAWRLPRDAVPASGAQTTWLERVLKGIWRGVSKVGDWIGWLARRLEEWLARQEEAASREPGEGGLKGVVRFVAIALAIVLGGALAVLAARRFRRRPAATPPVARPGAGGDSDAVEALRRRDDEWLALARELAEAGDLRGAVRTAFLALLAALAAHRWIHAEAARSNREYLRDLERRTDVPEDLPRRFGESIGLYEACWFGDHLPRPETWRRLADHLEAIRACSRA